MISILVAYRSIGVGMAKSRSHRVIGPYYACRYVGDDPNKSRNLDDPDDVDVVVWLLYESLPSLDGPRAVSGVLYNRRRDQPLPGVPEHRNDRWIARFHGQGHHHEERRQGEDRNFPGQTQGDAVAKLWAWDPRRNQAATIESYRAAVAAAKANEATFLNGGSCGG
jgi:hypothetical protein